MQKFYATLLYILLCISLLGACTSLPIPTTETVKASFSGNIIFTAAAQTVVAELTRVANLKETPTQIFSTITPTTQLLATSTPLFNLPCDRADFVLDVSYPDGSQVKPGETFIKVWRIRNGGTCKWNSSYSVIFDNGDAMGADASLPLTSKEISPGEELDISITMKAPSLPGLYRGEWKLRDSFGRIFGLGNSGSPFWVEIEVVSQ